MIEITRHEKDGVLQGFTFYTVTPVILLVHDNDYWYSNTKYRGHCSVGAPNANSIATAFETQQEVDDFIAVNNLIKFGEQYADWHEETVLRIIMHNNDIAKLLKDHPTFSGYYDHTIVEGNYSYIYLNWLEQEHEDLLINNYNAIKQLSNG
jgi:hypothetical protein